MELCIYTYFITTSSILPYGRSLVSNFFMPTDLWLSDSLFHTLLFQIKRPYSRPSRTSFTQHSSLFRLSHLPIASHHMLHPVLLCIDDMVSIIVLLSLTLLSTTMFFIFSVQLIRSLIFHTHISKASNFNTFKKILSLMLNSGSKRPLSSHTTPYNLQNNSSRAGYIMYIYFVNCIIIVFIEL